MIMIAHCMNVPTCPDNPLITNTYSETLVSFPGHFHLQSLVAWDLVTCGGNITYTAGRHVGVFLDEKSQSLSCNVHPRARGQNVHKATSIPFVVHDARDGSARSRNDYSWALLPCVYRMSLQVTRSPRPSPSIFAYCKQSGGCGLAVRLLKLSQATNVSAASMQW